MPTKPDGIWNLWEKIKALWWFFRNRRMMLPLLRFEIGSRFYSSVYNIDSINQLMLKLGLEFCEATAFLRTRNIGESFPPILIFQNLPED